MQPDIGGGGGDGVAPTDQPSALRHSTRVSRPPVRLICSAVTYGVASLFNVVAVILAAAPLTADDPSWAGGDEPTYAQALSRPDWHLWKAAMEEELESLAALSVFFRTKLPPGAKSLGVRWVLKIKRDAEGKAVCWKARLVVKGFQQRPGVHLLRHSPPLGGWCLCERCWPLWRPETWSCTSWT